MSATPKAQSAMAPEEWERGRYQRGDYVIQDDPPPEGGACVCIWDRNTAGDDSGFVAVQPQDRHALAALALHGQPFGFTRADADGGIRPRLRPGGQAILRRAPQVGLRT